MGLTGYEETSVVEVGAVLDTSPATAEEVYLRTIGHSERAIAAVAAKRAGGAGSSALSAATVRMTTNPAVSSTETLPFDVALSDPGSYFDPVTHLFTIPSGKGGLFLVGAEAGIDVAPAGATHCELSVNNSGDDHGTFQSIPFSLNATVSALMQLADGEELRCYMGFDSEDTLTVFGTQCKFWLIRVLPA